MNARAVRETCREQGAESERAESIEQRAESRGHGAKGREQRAWGREQNELKAQS